MKQILIIGAGRSSSALIQYTLKHAADNKWFVTVADASIEAAERQVNGHPYGRATWLDVEKPGDRRETISRADIVVSLMPPHLHLQIAQDCLRLRKHLVTASYVSRQLYQLHDEARQAALIFMGEMGLDPGIDHMSSMQTIHRIQQAGGQVRSFKSYTGGLVAPECDDNPWHYKFSWNPRNVILAGQGTAQYLHEGKYKYVPYHRLFREYELVEVPGLGTLEGYPNRDSLLYQQAYGLQQVDTLLRGTLRHRGYCDAWNALVQLGLTDDSYPILASGNLTYRELLEAYLRTESPSRGSLRERLARFLQVEPDSEVIAKLEWAGLLDNKKIGLDKASPAQILQHLLEKKWAMKPTDRDMVVMQHDFEYTLHNQRHRLVSTLIMQGDDAHMTAMSKLVGLPLAIFVKLVLQGKISATGVQIPTQPEVYTPILDELKDYGAVFTEQETTLS